MSRSVGAALAILTVLLPLRPAAAADGQSDSTTFTLEHVTTRDAATVVRTIAGIRELTMPDERTIEISGPEEPVELAAELVSAIDAAEVEPSQGFTTGDETVVAVIPLRDTSTADAMAALQELRLQRVAAVAEPGVVVVRDTPEKVASAVQALDAI